MARTDVALCDTSVAVALVVADHVSHGPSAHAVDGWALGLAGHAWFETYSVLTRLPAPARRDAATVAHLLEVDFPRSHFLDEAAQAALLRRLPALGIAGGSVYDALVGAAAAHHRLPLFTRDQRALATYRALDVDVRLIA